MKILLEIDYWKLTDLKIGGIQDIGTNNAI